MKTNNKVIMFLLFSLICGLLEAQITPILGFSAGYNLNEINIVEDLNVYLEYNHSNELTIQMKTGLKIDHLKVIGTYESTLVYLSIDEYKPIQDKFDIDITYDMGNFRFGFNHWCSHPVISQIDDRDTFVNSGVRSVYVSYYKEF